MLLEICDLACGYNKKAVLSGLRFSLNTGESVCILGKNGVGKTTIFKTILGVLPAISGSIRIDGIDVRKMPLRELARSVAYVPQAKSYAYPFSVLDTVLMGRAAHIGRFGAPSGKDVAYCKDVLGQIGMSRYCDQMYSKLSGGEQQMVLIARAMAQNAAFLLMDEPASNLDFANEGRLLELIGKLCGEGKGVLYITHSPSHALYCGGKALLLGDSGNTFGPVSEIVTEENLSRIYGVPVTVIEEERDGKAVRACCLK